MVKSHVRGRARVDKGKTLRLTRKRDVLLAFTTVSLPLLAIALILIGLIFNASERERPDLSVGTDQLPIIPYDTSGLYYTGTSPGSFLLLGSWASNIATICVAPFMIIFSYAVAREILQESTKDRTMSNSHPTYLKEMMRGDYVGLWQWGRHLIRRRNELAPQKSFSSRIVNVTGFGLLTASLLTILVIVGDNWLHATTRAVQITHYESVANKSQTIYYDPVINNQSVAFSPSVTINTTCDGTLTNPLPQNVSSAPLPCSLIDTNGVTNIAGPEDVYLTLGEGISQINSSFNDVDFSSLDSAEFSGDSTAYQIVTTVQNGTYHSILFNPNAPRETNLTDHGLGADFGFDYNASTISMTTHCTMTTRDCDIRAVVSASAPVDQNNISIPFHCYDDFAGNLGQTPATGHERAQGWNTSFYDMVDAVPRNVPVQAQSNPFKFYVAAAVNSIDYRDLPTLDGLEEGPDDIGLVDVGGAFVAFAMRCEATIYDVTFSLVDGNFSEFSTKKASPQKASIIKAPLQVGFGQYHLYEAAHVGILNSGRSIADTLSTAFSQTGMALASGVLDFDDNAFIRPRWTVTVTQIQKAPFWFLVVVCLIYSAFGIVMTSVAFLLRRRPEIRNHQARLMMEWAPDIDRIEANGEKAMEKRRRSRSSGRESLDILG